MFHFKHKDFVTSVLFHPELQDVFLSGTFANGIYAIDSKSGKVHQQWLMSDSFTTLKNNIFCLLSYCFLGRAQSYELVYMVFVASSCLVCYPHFYCHCPINTIRFLKSLKKMNSVII